MISQISGKIKKRKESSIVVDVNGISYEVLIPPAVMKGIEKANKTMHKYGIGAAIIYNWDMKRYVSSYWSHPYSKHIPHHFHLLLRDAGFPYTERGVIDPEGPSWLKDRLVGADILAEPLK